MAKAKKARARARIRHEAGSRAKLVEDTRRGGMTLVLGAGVTIPYRVPSWPQLVEDLWRTTFRRRMPRVQYHVPQLLPMALDRIADRLGTARFISALRRRLYQGVRPLSLNANGDHTSLALVARLLAREFDRGERRRISRVITFNVDDLLERSLARLRPDRTVLRPVARASHYPARGMGEQPIPVYHLHGFLPQTTEHRGRREAPDALIFTDSQYWTTAATPMSFANRVMAFALHDSRCIFIGTSMTDINIIRWLAIRATEIAEDKRNELGMHARFTEPQLKASVREALDRHYWIHATDEDPTHFLSEYLALRGVRGITVRDWAGSDFADLLEAAFPDG